MKIALVGDIMIGRLVNGVLKNVPPEYVWGTTLPLLAKADVRIGNLECALTGTRREWRTKKEFHFKSDIKNSAVLTTARVSAVSLANNHILDYEYEGLRETLKALDAAGIVHSGAGMNLEEAKQPAYITTNEGSVVVISVTDNEPTWEATLERPGVRYVPVDPQDSRARLLSRQIAALSSMGALVVVSLHWGSNWGYEPPKSHVLFAQWLIEAGANIIFGHSPHVIRGIEWYKARPIIYSAGNFIDDYAVDEIERNDETYIFMVTCTQTIVEAITLYPVIIKEMQATLATSDEADMIAQKMVALCAEFGTQVYVDKKAGCISVLSPAL